VQERQALVHILHTVNPHLSVVRFPNFLSRDDLQQLQQLYAIREVGEEVLNLHLCLRNKSPFAPLSGLPCYQQTVCSNNFNSTPAIPNFVKIRQTG